MATHQPSIHECRACGRLFVPAYGTKRRVYCSAVCGRRGRALGPTEQERRRAWQRLRRSRDRLLVAQGGRCAICNKTIPNDVDEQHPLRASVDHIVPLSVGGGHDLANLQAVHRQCNERKWLEEDPHTGSRSLARRAA